MVLHYTGGSCNLSSGWWAFPPLCRCPRGILPVLIVTTIHSVVFLFESKERKFPKFVSKEMENMYIEELKSSVNLLMANLESMPVSKGGSEFKLQKLKRSHNTSIIDMGEENENQLSKSDVVLSFSLEVSFALSSSRQPAKLVEQKCQQPTSAEFRLNSEVERAQ